MSTKTKGRVLKLLYGGTVTKTEFHYENLVAPPLLSLLSSYDIKLLHDLAMDPAMSGKPDERVQIMDSIVKARNFKRLSGGTNRMVYRHIEVPSIVIKCALDNVGISDNPHEMYNQRYIKPFCTKVFEVSPCGTVGLFERVERITSRYEFATIANDIYDMITKILVGKYVLNDFGTNFMYNWGIRKGFGPVILDFPYVYPLDGGKLFCKNVLEDGSICNGEIDYDDGFNFLTCQKCGKLHWAEELAKPPEESTLVHTKKGDNDMELIIMKGDKKIKEVNTKDVTEVMKIKREIKKPVTPITSKSDIHSVEVCVGYGKGYKDVLNKPERTNIPESTIVYSDDIKDRFGIEVHVAGGTPVKKKETKPANEKAVVVEPDVKAIPKTVSKKEEKPVENKEPAIEPPEEIVTETTEEQYTKLVLDDKINIKENVSIAKEKPAEAAQSVEPEIKEPVKKTSGSSTKKTTSATKKTETKSSTSSKSSTSKKSTAKKSTKKPTIEEIEEEPVHGIEISDNGANESVTVFSDSDGLENTALSDLIKDLKLNDEEPDPKPKKEIKSSPKKSVAMSKRKTSSSK